ncbi:extracellular solute-binding protein [Paenibacillus periandrae]|uniref:extracellular solute-binding protein n=1 Tax=Paenibacillus periandrae TaxID=1761741 RepID=UPI001F0970CE|nr:extracellular solute-binding protein [Paenibacillus periandrae]
MVMKQKSRQSLNLAVSLVLTSSVLLAGCVNGGSKSQDQGAEADNGQPFKITLMGNMYSEPPNPESEIQKRIEAYTNTKLQYTWVPASTYKEKVNATIASGELPMAILVTNNKDSNIISAVESGMFWEVGPYLKDYPFLSKLNKDTLNNTSVNGKIYGLFRESDLSTDGIMYRKDWLDNVGMKEPRTIDELYQVLKAFTYNDPDKNGKHDTVGLTEEKLLKALPTISIFMGAPNGWGEKDGKFTPDFMAPEYLQALKFFKKLYDEKIIVQDFAVLNNQQKRDVFKQGKAGAYLAHMADAPDLYSSVVKAFPEAKMDIVGNVKGTTTERTRGGTGYNGIIMIPKSSVKTEADLKKVLAFFDKMTDQKMSDLLGWGIEGRHFKTENGKPTFIDQKLWDTETNSCFNQMVITSLPNRKTPGEETALEKKKLEILPQSAKFAVINPTNPLISNTFNTKGVELTTAIDDAKTKYIYGKLDDAGWSNAIEEWRKNGGDKIMEEYAASFAKAKK